MSDCIARVWYGIMLTRPTNEQLASIGVEPCCDVDDTMLAYASELMHRCPGTVCVCVCCDSEFGLAVRGSVHTVATVSRRDFTAHRAGPSDQFEMLPYWIDRSTEGWHLTLTNPNNEVNHMTESAHPLQTIAAVAVLSGTAQRMADSLGVDKAHILEWATGNVSAESLERLRAQALRVGKS